MRNLVRPIAAVLGIAVAFAQAKQQQMAPPQKQAPAQAAPPAQQPQLKQIALTDKQVESVLAAQKDMDAITDKIPDNQPCTADTQCVNGNCLADPAGT